MNPAPRVSEVRGAGALAALDRGFLTVERWVAGRVPHALNPLAHTGAIANTALTIAMVTGVLLLFFYSSSVHLAYGTMLAMDERPYTSGLIRSLHRYSSDAAVFLVLVHAIRLTFERRIANTWWLAWVTGWVSLWVLWLVGWLGYWLVWDQRGLAVATASAKLLDVLPMFSDPMARSFLTGETVNSLLFFVVFFFHMLIPLAMGVVLWLHLARLSRPNWVAPGALSWWVLGVLTLLSVVWPATVSQPVAYDVLAPAYTMDWWYLAPLMIIERLGAGAAWGGFVLCSALLLGVPWMVRKDRSEVARVDIGRCNACNTCYTDCPFDAIRMVPRTDGKAFDQQAWVDPAKCVSCGICAGSCDTAGIGIDWLTALAQRRQIDGWTEGDEKPTIAFVCQESAGSGLQINPDGTSPELPGFRCAVVPCAGQVHMLTVERALKHGADGVLIATCGPDHCRYREGATWTEQRISGERRPALRTDKVAADRVAVVGFDATRTRDLVAAARSFRDTGATVPTAPRHALAAIGISLALCAVLAVVSDLGYASPPVDGSRLVVTFKHPGEISEECRQVTEEENAAKPAHMRRPEVCERQRSPVRLQIHIDGQRQLERTLTPTGLWQDGSSLALERIDVEPGVHEVIVRIGDVSDETDWPHVERKRIEFTHGHRRVLLFDRNTGFQWH